MNEYKIPNALESNKNWYFIYKMNLNTGQKYNVSDT